MAVVEELETKTLDVFLEGEPPAGFSTRLTSLCQQMKIPAHLVEGP